MRADSSSGMTGDAAGMDAGPPAAAERTWALLARVGLVVPGEAGERSLGVFDALAAPAAADALAGALAERLRPTRPEAIEVWQGLNSAILGYAVARHLDVPVIVLSDDEGLVTASAAVRRGARVAFVAPLTPGSAVARMAAGYLESRGVTLVATAALLAQSGAGSALVLAELPAESASTETLPRRLDGDAGGETRGR
ncbi:MAG: hypothetical protein IT305_19700 [Chloroflexi bacterium]|nr:hypothetical protein [Chloroflexota bacterium]